MFQKLLQAFSSCMRFRYPLFSNKLSSEMHPSGGVELPGARYSSTAVLTSFGRLKNGQT